MFFGELRRVARSWRVYGLILQPPDNGEPWAVDLPRWGFQPSSIGAFPTATVLIDLNQDLDAIMANMKSKTRYNIRLGRKKGIVVREETADDLPEFYRILTDTSQRQSFSTYSEAYYREMNRIFGQFGYFKLFLAEYQGEPVSAMFAISFGDTVLFKRGGWSGRHGNRRPN